MQMIALQNYCLLCSWLKSSMTFWPSGSHLNHYVKKVSVPNVLLTGLIFLPSFFRQVLIFFFPISRLKGSKPVKSSRVPNKQNILETRQNSLRTSVKPCTPPKLCPTPKDSCFYVRLPKFLIWSWTTVASLSCGVADVLLDQSSLETSKRPMTKIPNWTISFWMISSKKPLMIAKHPGGKWLLMPSNLESQPLASQQVC